jgi:hypothetical protein
MAQVFGVMAFVDQLPVTVGQPLMSKLLVHNLVERFMVRQLADGLEIH